MVAKAEIAKYCKLQMKNIKPLFVPLNTEYFEAFAKFLG